MQSRIGTATKSQFTCFFRGAKGETGGKNFQETCESPIKKLKRVVEHDISDVITEPVNAPDVLNYITFEVKKK